MSCIPVAGMYRAKDFLFEGVDYLSSLHRNEQAKTHLPSVMASIQTTFQIRAGVPNSCNWS